MTDPRGDGAGTDTVFRNGHVFDGHRYRPGCAVAVAGGRVVAVGEDDDVRSQIGADAEEVDLAGGLLMPGFHDSHMHPMVGGLERRWVELSEVSTQAEYLEGIARAAADRPGDGWLRGGGWSIGAFDSGGPSAALLDSVVADRPVFLPSTDHHDAWVNTAALRLAGIDRTTPDPPDGWIERDREGNPTGTLREGAMTLVWDHVETTRSEYADSLREAQSYLHSWGISGWHDALIGGYAGLDDPTQAYLDLLDNDELTARVRCSQWWDRARGVEQLAELVAQRDQLARRGLDAGSVKVMMDGIGETFTASMTDGYDDPPGCPCGDHGIAFLSREQAIEAVVAIDAAGMQVHFHAIGDKAVHDALDAVEAARRVNGMNDLRHQIAHLQLVRPEDRHRLGALQVVANLQGMWVRSDTAGVTLLEPHLGAERSQWQYPFADILAGGARFCGGSDWPVNPPEPIAAVHALVNRRSWTAQPADAAPPLVPSQAIGLDAALEAYTRGSAWADHYDDGGFVHVGVRADLVVLDRDPFGLPSEQIGSVEIASTWASGRCVYRR